MAAAGWLVNGSPDGLVELAIDPPCYLAPGIDTLFRRAKVERLISAWPTLTGSSRRPKATGSPRTGKQRG